MKSLTLLEAVSDSRIYGYGVSDTGDRHGGADESAEYGLCYPRGRPLTLMQAMEIKREIGLDAAVIAFSDGEKWPMLVKL